MCLTRVRHLPQMCLTRLRHIHQNCPAFPVIWLTRRALPLNEMRAPQAPRTWDPGRKQIHEWPPPQARFRLYSASSSAHATLPAHANSPGVLGALILWFPKACIRKPLVEVSDRQFLGYHLLPSDQRAHGRVLGREVGLPEASQSLKLSDIPSHLARQKKDRFIVATRNLLKTKCLRKTLAIRARPSVVQYRLARRPGSPSSPNLAAWGGSTFLTAEPPRRVPGTPAFGRDGMTRCSFRWPPVKPPVPAPR